MKLHGKYYELFTTQASRYISSMDSEPEAERPHGRSIQPDDFASENAHNHQRLDGFAR